MVTIPHHGLQQPGYGRWKTNLFVILHRCFQNIGFTTKRQMVERFISSELWGCGSSLRYHSLGHIQHDHDQCACGHLHVTRWKRSDGSGTEFRWGRDFPHPSRPALGPTQPLYDGHRVSFPGIKRPRGVVNHPPPASAEVKEKVELYLYSPWVFVVCSRVNFTFLPFSLETSSWVEKCRKNRIGVKRLHTFNAMKLI
jgi:hypothetical protein